MAITVTHISRKMITPHSETVVSQRMALLMIIGSATGAGSKPAPAFGDFYRG